MIDVGTNNTHMYVVQSQQLQFMRGVKFGSGAIVRAVSKEFNLSFLESEAMLSAPGTELWNDGILKVTIRGISRLTCTCKPNSKS